MKRKSAEPITPWEALQEASKLRDRQEILDKAVSMYLMSTATSNDGKLPYGEMNKIIMSLGAKDWLTRHMVRNRLLLEKREDVLVSEVVKKNKKMLLQLLLMLMVVALKIRWTLKTCRRIF